MAKLPSALQLGDLARVESGRQIATYDASALSRAAAAMTQGGRDLGDGITKLGNALVAAQAKQANADEELANARALSNWNTSKVEHEIGLGEDNNYEDMAERTRKTLTEHRDAAAALIPDPVKREKFVLSTQDDIGRGVIAATNRARRLEGSAQVGWLDQQEQRTINGLVQMTDPQARADGIFAHHKLVDSYVTKGWLDATQAQNWKDRFRTNYASADAQARADRGDIDGVISDLEQARLNSTLQPEQPKPAVRGLGQLSAKYESRGDWGTGGKDNIGWAYGRYQFNSRGSLNDFLRDHPDIAKRFDGVDKESPAFAARWRQVHKELGSAFEEAQQQTFLKHAQPSLNKAQALGFKTDDLGVMESLLSGSIQHGKWQQVLSRAAQAKGFAEMSPQDQIRTLYQARADYVSNLGTIDDNTRAGVLKRYQSELPDALKLAGQKVASADGSFVPNTMEMGEEGAAKSRPAGGPDGLFGYKIRDQLHPGEDRFFKENPGVAGMAAETGDIILNPYSPKSVNRDAVARNEALRLYMRDKNIAPDFAVTDAQRAAFKGTPYENDDAALKATIAARIYSGDPSARATPEQREWVAQNFGEQSAAERKPNIYDFLPGPQREQLLNAMQTKRDQLQTKQQAAAAEGYERQIIDASAGKGPLPERSVIEQAKDIDEARRNNLLVRYDKAAGDVASFQSALGRYRAGEAFNPYEKEDRDNVDKIFAALGGDDAALTTITQKTRVMPQSAATKMRADFISNDTKRVIAGATRASNLLAANPNIFAKTEGGDEIEKTAVKFRAFVDDFGMTAEDAANRLIREQTPEYKASVNARVKGEDIDDLIKKKLAVSDLAGAFDDSFLGLAPNPAVGGSVRERDRMFDQYAQLVKENYLDLASGDLDVAKKLAAKQVAKTWGVSNVSGSAVLMQYPPEKSPVYHGIENAYEKIGKQAVADIKQQSGHDIEQKNIRLSIIPGTTAQSFKSGQPPRYRLEWVDKNGVIQRSRLEWYADPASLREQQAIEREQKFNEAVQTQRDRETAREEDPARKYIGKPVQEFIERTISPKNPERPLDKMPLGNTLGEIRERQMKNEAGE